MPILKIDTDLGTVSVVKMDGTEEPVTLPQDASASDKEDLLDGGMDEDTEDMGGGGDLGSMMDKEAAEGPEADANETADEQAKEDAMGTEKHPSAAAAAQGKGASPFGAKKAPLFGAKQAPPLGPKKAPKTYGW